MAERFVSVTGAAAPILRANIDTDTLAPARLEKDFGEKGGANIGAFLFANWRYQDDIEEIPDFILNRAEFREAKILLAGPNFGCGSSRESAVWALKAFGIEGVIAPSFGEIFYNNCFKNGVLPVMLDFETVQALAEEATPGAPEAMFTVDLEAQSVATPSGRAIAFSVPAFRRQALLEGLDEIAVTMRRQDEIDAFMAQARAARPWAYPRRR